MSSLYPEKFSKHIMIPDNFSEMPEIIEITRRLCVKKTEVMGKLILLLEMRHRAFKRTIPLTTLHYSFGVKFIDALCYVGWGYKTKKSFCFKPPENILSRPGRSVGGRARAESALRDRFGRFKPKKIRPKYPRLSIDTEGNPIF